MSPNIPLCVCVCAHPRDEARVVNTPETPLQCIILHFIDLGLQLLQLLSLGQQLLQQTLHPRTLVQQQG